MKNLIIILFALFTLSSCVKKVNCEGTVYSKAGKPLPDIAVYLYVYTSGKDAALPHPYTTTTDKNGHFIFSEMIAKNRSFGLGANNGNEWFHQEHLSREQLKHYNIHLK